MTDKEAGQRSVPIKSLKEKPATYLTVPVYKKIPILFVGCRSSAMSADVLVDEADESDVSLFAVFELREIESIDVFLPNRPRSTFRSE